MSGPHTSGLHHLLGVLKSGRASPEEFGRAIKYVTTLTFAADEFVHKIESGKEGATDVYTKFKNALGMLEPANPANAWDISRPTP